MEKNFCLCQNRYSELECKGSAFFVIRKLFYFYFLYMYLFYLFCVVCELFG